jgi:transcriptional regulator with XRE-family HTH domain
MSQPIDDLAEQRFLGRALALLRAEANLSQEEAGERFGTSGQNFAKYELGKAPAIHQPSVQDRLARAVGADREMLLAKRASLVRLGAGGAEIVALSDRAGFMPRPQPLGLPIRHGIMAAWAFAYDDVNPETWPLGRDTRYPAADQWLAEIRDDSAEGLGLRRGELAHLVAAEEIGYYARHGDIVEVERLREGEERELTLREIEVTAAGVRLWARSPSVRLRDPLELPAAAGQPGAPRILGLLLNSVRRY